MLQFAKNRIKNILVPKNKLVIFNYHQVSEVFDSKIHGEKIWNSRSDFLGQMKYLKSNYQVVSLKEGIERLRAGSIKDTLVSITFDDGDSSIVSDVMPMLESLNLPATFFINTAYGTDKIGYWFNLGPYLQNSKMIELSKEIRNTINPVRYNEIIGYEDVINASNKCAISPFYADLSELSKCTNPLFDFGLHGHEHHRFSMLSKERQFENLKVNIDVMRNWPNYVPYFAIPYGTPVDWNKDTLDISKELGVLPILAFQGYNTRFNLPLLRFSVDGKNLKETFFNFSPYQSRYYNLNNVQNRK